MSDRREGFTHPDTKEGNQPERYEDSTSAELHCAANCDHSIILTSPVEFLDLRMKESPSRQFLHN